jgi:hypothetical protein
MPGYVAHFIRKLQHDNQKYAKHPPSRYVTSVYGAKPQYATRDETPPIRKTMHKHPKYKRLLSGIAMELAKATDKTQAATYQLLAYVATHPDETL